MDQDYFNYIFRTILGEKRACYVQNQDQDKKPYRNINLNPFEFLVFSEKLNKNYIVEIVGNEYPRMEKKGQILSPNYDVRGQISTKKDSRKQLEHTIIWQNIFQKSFSSILIFMYVFADYSAEKAFKEKIGDTAYYFNIMVEYKFYEKKKVYCSLLASSATDYLEYINTHELKDNELEFSKEDAPKYLKNPIEFIPELRKKEER